MRSEPLKHSENFFCPEPLPIRNTMFDTTVLHRFYRPYKLTLITQAKKIKVVWLVKVEYDLSFSTVRQDFKISLTIKILRYLHSKVKKVFNYLISCIIEKLIIHYKIHFESSEYDFPLSRKKTFSQTEKIQVFTHIK